MFRVGITTHFDAAHRLKGYPGPCERLHGHRWDVEVILEGSELDRLGMLVDFKTVKDRLRSILDEFDHHYINEVGPFQDTNPTAENLAQYIYHALRSKGLLVVEVTVWESPDCWARFWNPREEWSGGRT